MKPHKRYHKYRHLKTRKRRHLRKIQTRKHRQHGGLSLKDLALGAAAVLGFSGVPSANAALAPAPVSLDVARTSMPLPPRKLISRRLPSSRFVPSPSSLMNTIKTPSLSNMMYKSYSPNLKKPYTLGNSLTGNEIKVTLPLNVNTSSTALSTIDLNSSITSNIEKIPLQSMELNKTMSDIQDIFSSQAGIDVEDIKELSESKSPEEFEEKLSEDFQNIPIIKQNNITYSEIISSTSPANIITIGGHNTLTNIPQQFSEINIISPNQKLSIDDMLETCVESKVCLLDIDIDQNQFGQISSKHGGIILGLANASNAETAASLTKVFNHAKEHPDVVYTIRIENNGVFGPAELHDILTPEQQNQLFSYSKNSAMPSFNEIQSSGRNVRVFMEKNNNALKSDRVSIDASTGNYVLKSNGTALNVMAQDHHVLRTRWSQIEPIHKASASGNMTLLESLLVPSPNLGTHFEIMVDAYETSFIGANLARLPEVANMTAQINDVILPAIQNFAQSKGKTPAEGALIMVDYFTPEHAQIARNWNIINNNLNNTRLKNELILINRQMLNAIHSRYQEYLSDTGIIDMLKKIFTLSMKSKNVRALGFMSFKFLKYYLIPYYIWLFKKHLWDREAKKAMTQLKNKENLKIDKLAIFINDILFCYNINDTTSMYISTLSLIASLIYAKIRRTPPGPENRGPWLKKFGLANKVIDKLIVKLCPDSAMVEKIRKLVNDFAEDGTIREDSMPAITL
jgi:hypothetical protein